MVTEFDGLPVLRRPVAIVAFEGWNDAADSATSAVEHLEDEWHAESVVEMDGEDYYDFQVTRPVLTIDEDGQRQIEWPASRFSVARPPGAERDVVLLRGIEPSLRWRSFCDDILEICHALEVRDIILLGALLADVPYTRPLPVSGGISDPVLRDQLRLTDARYEGPIGIVGVLQQACVRAELPVTSLWVHVPHYASSPPCPKAELALLHRIEEILDLPVPVAGLAEEAGEWEARVATVVEQDSELSEYLRELEQRAGEPHQPPTGEELATEFEKYLRRRNSR